MYQKLIIGILTLIFPALLLAQKGNDEVRRGNNAYRSDSFTDAEVLYRKGLAKDSTSVEGNYDLGNALYKQGKIGEANHSYFKALDYAKSTKRKLSKTEQAAVFHNIGNTLLAAKEYGKSIEAYKQALRLNPADNETRYNLAYAQMFLKNQQQQQNQNQQKNDKQKQEQQNQQPQQSPQEQEKKMDKQQAQQLLDAVLQNDQQPKKQQRSSRQQYEKDW